MGLWAVALCAGAAWAADEADDAAALSNKVDRFLAAIEYKTGEVSVGDGLARLNVPPAFRFVGQKDAEKILLLWGNPPGETPPLGMLFPAGATPTSEDAWAVVLQYEESGYVKDDDADHIDYGELLATMQKGTLEASKERVKEGYEAIELVGWAAPPRYDKATHKMYWAKEIKFGDEPEHTLNYNIRILGRRGVLVLNAVAAMDQLREIEAATPGLLAMVDFQEGHRYVDFDPAKDKYAAYGLAALVAGGVAAKAGFFKGLLVALLAAKKVVIVGVIALVAMVKKFFGRRERNTIPRT
jgi:uncharacterized membrane-anchored protein